MIVGSWWLPVGAHAFWVRQGREVADAQRGACGHGDTVHLGVLLMATRNMSAFSTRSGSLRWPEST